MRFFLNVNLRSNFCFFENLKIFEYLNHFARRALFKVAAVYKLFIFRILQAQWEYLRNQPVGIIFTLSGIVAHFALSSLG